MAQQGDRPQAKGQQDIQGRQGPQEVQGRQGQQAAQARKGPDQAVGKGQGATVRQGTPEGEATRIPKQQQELPGLEQEMTPEPVVEDPRHTPTGKLAGKVALITGGDSGIGRAVAILFAREGADIAILYLNEHPDAEKTEQRVKELGRRCMRIAGDVGDAAFCEQAVERVAKELGRIDLLINNAAEQQVVERIEDITPEQFERTFRTNIFGYFFMARAAMKHLQKGACIINTTSIQAYDPSPTLLDYASTKGAILTFTRALSKQLIERGIRVNAVAPGPVWTPLIPATFPADKVAEFGKQSPLERPAQPCEIAPSFLFLASEIDSSYMTGQVLHPNGGEATAS